MNRGEIDRYLDSLADDFAFRADRRLAAGEPEDMAVGRRGFVRFIEDSFSAWHEVRYEFDPDASVVGGCVFSHDRWVGRLHAGDPETSIEFYAVATVGKTRVTEVAVFAEREDALAHANRER